MSSEVAGGYTRVAALRDVAPGQLLGVQFDAHRVCLANVDGEIFAFRDNCTHKDFPLSAGSLEGDRVECQWHGARFDVRTGRAVALPAIRPVKTYDVKIEGDDILVALG